MLAQGCTEPIAIALAAVKCREMLGREAETICVNLSGSMTKSAGDLASEAMIETDELILKIMTDNTDN